VSEAEWTFFLETLRSGEVLQHHQAYAGIQVGLISNRPVPRFFAEQIRASFGEATKIEKNEAKFLQLFPTIQEKIVEAEGVIDFFEAKKAESERELR
jgi:hypothetical protein